MLSRLKGLFSRRAADRPTPKPARTARPTIETLEDRVTPSVGFATDNYGTYAYNSSTGSYKSITTLRPVDFSEGQDGTLFASFSGSGTWRYTYSNNQWTKLTGAVAPDLDATDGGTLYATLGDGTYRYSTSGAWTKLTSSRATELAGVNGTTFYATFGAGVYRYANGTFRQLASAGTEVLSTDNNGQLVASFGSGTWTWNGAWKRITTAVATDVAGPTGGVIYAGFSNGTYRYNVASGAWTQIAFNPSRSNTLAVEQRDGQFDDGRLYGSYASGTWYYTLSSNAWTRISTLTVNQIAS